MQAQQVALSEIVMRVASTRYGPDSRLFYKYTELNEATQL